MNGDSWQQVNELFHTAVEMSPADRVAFLDSACSGDALLRSDIESLLAADSADWAFLERPAIESAAIVIGDDEPRLSAHQKLSHYEIVELIGRGGMGEVYVARDTILNRKVALKLLPFEYTEDDRRLRRFRREAETVSALNHPNIITIHEFGNDGAFQFIATELIDGENLRDRLRPGPPLPVHEALEIAIQTASALAAAHRAGIVHRDIKPENIMLRPDGYVKVLDFGLAKLAAHLEPQSVDLTVLDTSSSEVLMGTLRYMSPEQISGSAVDARSDIFSLGVVLYEMLTGRRPFENKNQAELIKSILNDDPSALGDFGIEGSNRLAGIMRKMLIKDLSRRYQTAEELLLDLRQFKEELNSFAKGSGFGSAAQMISSSTARPGRRSLVLASIVVLAVASAIGYASFEFIGRASADAPESLETGTWATKASISSARWNAEPVVVNDALYVVGGWNVCSPVGELEQYDPETNSWMQRAPMRTPRGGHGVGALEGKIYAVGGSVDCGVHTASMEVYDPANDSWSEKAPLATARFGHVVAAARGKLYVIGGAAPDGKFLSLNSEYDPAKDAWTERTPMPTPRQEAAVAVVNDVIYVIGGNGYGGSLATVEAYDPLTDSWSTRHSMLMSRVSFAASEVGGLVYAFGGRGDRIQVEAYDPEADVWKVAARMPSPKTHFHGATYRGSIYLIGGLVGVDYTASVTTFTPESTTSGAASCPTVQSTMKAALPTKRSSMTVGEVGGIIYVVGGFENTAKYLDVNEAYDPAMNTWTEKAPIPNPRETRGSNNAVVDGKLYVIGGNAAGKCSDLNEAYDPVTNMWTAKAPMPTPRCHLAVVALDGLIYAMGGTNTNGSIEYGTVEVYDPSSDTWHTAAPMPTGRQDLGAAALNGVIYAVGGGNPAVSPTSELNVVEAYDPAKGTWTTIAPMLTARSAMGVGVLNGMLVVAGGLSNEKSSGSVEAYDPGTGTWKVLSTAAPPRAFFSTVTVNDTMYALGGNGAAHLNSSTAMNEAINLTPCAEPK